MGVLPSLCSVSRLEYVLQLQFSKKGHFQEEQITVFSSYSSEFVGGNHEHCIEQNFLVIRTRTMVMLAPGHEEIVLLEDGVDEHPADVEMHIT